MCMMDVKTAIYRFLRRLHPRTAFIILNLVSMVGFLFLSLPFAARLDLGGGEIRLTKSLRVKKALGKLHSKTHDADQDSVLKVADGPGWPSLGRSDLSSRNDSRDFIRYYNVRTIVLFQHIHKCGGSFLISLVSAIKGQDMPNDNALIYCPHLSIRPKFLNNLCGRIKRPLLAYWTWPASIQQEFLTRLNYTFIANERWLGEELTPRSFLTDRTNSANFRYLTIIRDPLDRIISHYYFMNELRPGSVNRTFSEFVKGGPCQSSDAGFRCWDSNLYLQIFAGTDGCTSNMANQALHGENYVFNTSCSVSNATAALKLLTLAKHRLSESFIVLNLDWLSFSGPLLCKELGYCDSNFQEKLQNLSSKVVHCGAQQTLKSLPDQNEVLSTLRHNNALDIELYEFARQLAKKQLREAGVHTPLPESSEKRSCDIRPPKNVSRRASNVSVNYKREWKCIDCNRSEQIAHGNTRSRYQNRKMNATSFIKGVEVEVVVPGWRYRAQRFLWRIFLRTKSLVPLRYKTEPKTLSASIRPPGNRFLVLDKILGGRLKQAKQRWQEGLRTAAAAEKTALSHLPAEYVSHKIQRVR